MKLSVIIPSFREPYLQQTIDDFLFNSRLGYDVEVIAVIDGGWRVPKLVEDPRVKVVVLQENRGMRGSINAGISVAKGEYILKVDAHCIFCEGFDKLLVESCTRKCLMTPRRYSIDETDDDWRMGRKYADYHYLVFPTKTKFMSPQRWGKRNKEQIDETMTIQGSCWLANKDYFMKTVGYLDDREETYASIAGDQLEIGLKYWLNDGVVKVNKGVSYGHLFKGKRHYEKRLFHRKHKGGASELNWKWATNHWFNNQDKNVKRKLSWLVEKFSPVPTWPENKEEWAYEDY